jgi:acyl carrier protein
MSSDIKIRVRNLVAETFDLAVDNLPERLDMDHIAGWDSLGHLTLITRISDDFGIEISLTEAVEMLSEDEIVSVLNRKIAGGS